MTDNSEFRAAASHEIADVWAGTPAGFDLCTRGNRQFAAFYDAERRITLGQRTLGETDWTFVRFPDARRIEWDAHNYLTIAVDDEDRVHVAGNMHVDPLTYFRTTEPLDVTTTERVQSMVGNREDRVTYPQFLREPDDELVFKYRHGESGAGDWIYDVYDAESAEWRRLLDEPITYGGDRMNAYPHGPVVGPDGYYHLCWVWRDTPAAETNHDLSYARSEDLRGWETSDGERLDLPITIDACEIVDPVPPEGGTINGNTKIGFDAEDRVVLSYHKFDDDGNTQVYSARRESDGWTIHRTSDWDYRWEFGGTGTIPFEIEIDPVSVDEDGRLVQTYDHAEYGPGKWVLDGESLKPVEHVSPRYRYPERLREARAEYPGMRVNWAEDSGASPDDIRYALRWETLGPNRDRAREEAPPPTTLRCYEFEPRR